jgi:hypothetical protein
MTAKIVYVYLMNLMTFISIKKTLGWSSQMINLKDGLGWLQVYLILIQMLSKNKCSNQV